MSKVLVLVNAFQRVEFVERTIRSILKQQTRSQVEIIVLENPSEKSPQMRQMVASIAEIRGHQIADQNIGNEIFGVQYNKNMDKLREYDFITFTEGDVVLEPTALNECVRILASRNMNKACGVGIRVDDRKQGALNRDIIMLELFTQEIPGTRQCIGRTGFRFHMMKRGVVMDFARRLPMRGTQGMWCEQNLNRQCIDEQIISIKTKEALCEHIGWEWRLPGNEDQGAKQEDAKRTLRRDGGGGGSTELREIFQKLRVQVRPVAPVFRGRVQ